MTHNAGVIRKKLYNSITTLTKSAQSFTIKPEKDFSRNRKLSFEKTISIILGMRNGTLSHELLDYFNFSFKTCSSSAFIQQRAKIKPDAFEFLFHEFTDSFSSYGKYRDYTLLAADGTDVITGPDPSSPKAFYVEHNSGKQYNLYHVNALYNLTSSIYSDIHIQESRDFNEHVALAKMVDRSAIEKAILIADRGYEGYNTLAHLQRKGWKYLIRLKRGQGILKALDLPDTDDFDVPFNLKLLRRQTNLHKKLAQLKNEYKIINSNVKFDYLKENDDEIFALPFRVVRFRISTSLVETVITNLPADLFKPEELKGLYAMRWGIETSFRELKYIVGMMHFHARKTNFVYQEIFARILMHNFAKLIISCLTSNNKSGKNAYKINFSTAFHICRQFFNNAISSIKALKMISRYLTPVRDKRQYIRIIKSKPPVSFVYRVA